MKDIDKRKRELDDAEYQDDRRERTAIFYSYLRIWENLFPQVCDLLKQSWNEKDDKKYLELQKKAVSLLPPDIAKTVKANTQHYWEELESYIENNG